MQQKIYKANPKKPTELSNKEGQCYTVVTQTDTHRSYRDVVLSPLNLS